MRGIELLHPDVGKQAEALLVACAKAGLGIKIGETWRSIDEQNALYAQGRDKPGAIVTNAKGDQYQSAHQWGCAFDFFRSETGKNAYDDSDGFFSKVGAIGKSLNPTLFWGGDFSKPDKPHFEDPRYIVDSSTNSLKSKYGTPEKFKATWNNG